MKNVMITGANSGLGFETARKIAEDNNYAVILACRNKEKAEKAKEEIIQKTGNPNISIQILDTSSLASVRKCIEDIKAENMHLDVLICNAGISPIHSGTTSDGFELVFETNYLGHFLLTMGLLPTLNKEAGIMHVTSDMHNPPQGLKWKGADYLAYHGQEDHQRYSYSKLCNILFTYSLADKLKAVNSSITVNCFNPGYMSDTNFSGKPGNNARAFVVKKTMPNRYSTLEDSSTALADLIKKNTYRTVSGKYFDRIYGIGSTSPLSHDQEIQAELWKKSQEYTPIHADQILKEIA